MDPLYREARWGVEGERELERTLQPQRLVPTKAKGRRGLEADMWSTHEPTKEVGDPHKRGR